MALQGSTDAGHEPALARVFTPLTQRERLLDGIAWTVARRGYAATPVAEILKAAGVSRRTFYEQFADKEDCFLAAYDAIVNLCNERLLAAYRDADGWENGIAHAYDALLRTLAAEPDFAHLAVVDVLAAGPVALARRDATLRRLARLIGYVREPAESAVAPSALVGRAIVGGIHELVYSRIVRGDAARLPDLADELLHYTFILLGTPRSIA